MRAPFALLLLTAAGGTAVAQESYPNRQITLIAPYAAGGSTDLVARVLSDGLKARFNQAFTVDNRPGGNGVIGTREVVKAAPDGYTLLIGALGAQVLPAVMAPNFPFNPLRDFTPVAAAAEWAGVMLVKKDLPVRSLPEFIAYAKARPGALNFGTSGYGSTVHLIAEILMKETGIRMQHVPYKGGASSMTDLMAGSLDVLFTSSPVAVGQAANPNVRMLAVASRQRLKLLPDVPTMAELGLHVTQTQWLGPFRPAAPPTPPRHKLSAPLRHHRPDPPPPT